MKGYGLARCPSDNTWQDEILQQVQALCRTQTLHYQYFHLGLLSIDTIMLKLQTETHTVSALRRKAAYFLKDSLMQEKENSSGRSTYSTPRSLWARRMFCQTGSSSYISTAMAGSTALAAESLCRSSFVAWTQILSLTPALKVLITLL